MSTIQERLSAMSGGTAQTATSTTAQTIQSRLAKMRSTAATQNAEDVGTNAALAEKLAIRKAEASTPTTATASDIYTPATAQQSFVEPTTQEVVSGLKTTGNRLKNIFSGAAKGTAADYLSAAGTTQGLAESGAGTISTQELQSMLDDATKRRDEAKSAVRRQLASGEITAGDEYYNEYQSIINRAQEQITAYSKGLAANKALTGQAQKESVNIAQSAQEDIDTAKEGLGTAGKFLVDVGVTGAQIAGDLAVGVATGTGILAPMFFRASGSGAREATASGATVGQAALYGVSSGALEVATEKLFSLSKPFTKMFGKGASDDIVNNLISKLTTNKTGASVLKMLASATGEGLEEIISGAVQPALQTIYNNESIGQSYSDMDISDTLYQGLVGLALGGLGGAVDVVNATADSINAQTATQNTIAPNLPKTTLTSSTPTASNVSAIPTLPTSQTAQTTSTATANKAQNESQAQGAATPTMPEGVGAASKGFAGTVERGFSRNVATDNAMNETIREDYTLDPEMYNRLGNKDTLTKAQAIYDSGLGTARATVEQAIGAARNGAKLSPETVPLARMVANTLANQGDLDGARNILSSVAIELTQAGQLSQAANILRQSDAATVLQTVEKQLQKINEAGRKKYGKNWKDFTLNEDELQAISKINAGDTVAIQAVIQMVGKRIGSEMPTTAWNKITEFRRVAMLLNPKTQIRNILGNVPLMGMRKLSETMSAAVQDMAVNMGLLDSANQTRTLGVSKQSKTIANELYQQQKSALMKIDKWDITSIINEYQTVFKTVPLEKVRKFTYWLLERGDLPFLKSAFVDNAAGYIEAQGYKTAYDVPQKVIDAATKEALAATFRDASALAQWLNVTKRNSGAAGAALDVLLPFTTTPINIARRTADYSPLGALKLLDAKNRAEATTVIDTLTKSVTGSGIMFLGFMLAKLGWITGGQDDDRDKAQFEIATGKQPYSIMGKYSYDWAQPVGTQLAIGAEMYKAIQGDTTLINAIMNSIYAGGDAMLNLTFFSNIQDLFDGYGSTTENTAETLATGFASQLIPTLLGQFTRTTDTSVRSTYTGGSLFEDILAQAKSKIPGLSATLPQSINIRGEAKTRLANPLARAFEQFLSPGTVNVNEQNSTDEEIQRVYDSTGDVGVFPRYALGYFTAGGTKYTMTGEERSQFQATLGTETYAGLESLFKNSEYKSATDAEKSSMIADVISAANDKAKQELVEARGDMYLTTSGRETVTEYVSAGLTEKKAYELYKAIDALEPLTGETSVSTFQKVQTINKQSYTQTQKTALIASLYTTHDSDGNLSKESLLPALNISDNLISRYLTTQDTDFINMTVPASFTSDKVEYELTDKERQLFRSTYVEYFNSRANNVLSDDALKKLRDEAYDAAKQAVLQSING